MQSKAKTVKEYLQELPEERREAIKKIRQVIIKNLPEGYKESMQFGMIGYSVPLETYPHTYNKAPLLYAALAAQKNHIAVYVNNVYGDSKILEWFKREWEKTGKKLDMGKSCIRFKAIEEIPLELIGRVIAKTSVKAFIKMYEQSRV